MLASGDPRFGLPPKDECRAQLDEVKAGRRPTRPGRDGSRDRRRIDLDATIEAVAKRWARCRREPSRRSPTAQREFPAEPFAMEFTIVTEIPRGSPLSGRRLMP